MNNKNQLDIYSPKSVISLFDEMSQTYGAVNLIASLGFTSIWRKVFISKLNRKNVGLVVDLMTGMGESLPNIQKHLQGIGHIKGIDFSPKMCESAREQVKKLSTKTEIIEADIFEKTIPAGTADIVMSSFGLKTFSLQQQSDLAKEVNRLLAPHGEFSFIEISIPQNRLLQLVYKIYLNILIPMIGKVCLGNPDNYRFLGVYTQKFGNSKHFHQELVKIGLEAHYFEHFFGCASGVYGRKKN